MINGLLSPEGQIIWGTIIALAIIFFICILGALELFVRGLKNAIKAVQWLLVPERIFLEGKVVSSINKSYFYSNALLNDCGSGLCDSIIEVQETFIEVVDCLGKSYQICLNNPHPQYKIGDDVRLFIRKMHWEKVFLQED